MISGISLTIGGVSYANLLSTYEAIYETTYARVITTLSGKERGFRKKSRLCITFSLIPLTASQISTLREKLSAQEFSVTCTDPMRNSNVTKSMRCVSDLEQAFGINSIDGNIYYTGKEIELRAVEVES